MSLHRRIYADLEGLILSGALSPGDRIPFEHELTERYDCSRMTVSKAISELAGRGLVTRRRRAGTFVAQPKAHAAVLAIPDLRAEVIERGQAYGYVLLERIEREPDGADEIELASGGLLLDLTCLHSADGAPLALVLSTNALAQQATAQDATTLDGIEVVGDKDAYQVLRISSATKTDTPLRDVPQSVTVITRQRMDDQGMRSLDDVVQALKKDPKSIVVGGGGSVGDSGCDGGDVSIEPKLRLAALRRGGD